MAEFIEWLDYIENQLDSVCYCAKIATAAAASSTSSASTNAARSVSERESKISDHSPIAATSDCHSSSELSLSRVSQKPASSLHIDSAGVEEKHLTEIEEIPAFHVVEEGEEEAIDEDVEAEELLMSLQPMTSSKLRASSTKLCLPETVDDWTVISARHSVSGLLINLYPRCDRPYLVGYVGTDDRSYRVHWSVTHFSLFPLSLRLYSLSCR